MQELNVYQKIQYVRAQLVDMKLKKTGKNDYSKFMYYELGDFLPSLNRLMDDVGLMTRFNIQPKRSEQTERAILEVFNSEKPSEKLVWYSETKEVAIGSKKDGSGGAEPIQNLGGKITYMRRYLLMSAFEIIESDMVDARTQTQGKETLDLSPDEIEKINQAGDMDQLKEVCAEIKKNRGIRYQNVLVRYYTTKKEELMKKNDVSVGGQGQTSLSTQPSNGGDAPINGEGK